VYYRGVEHVNITVLFMHIPHVVFLVWIAFKQLVVYSRAFLGIRTLKLVSRTNWRAQIQGVWEENVWREVFGLKRKEEATGGWWKLYDEELHRNLPAANIMIVVKLWMTQPHSM